MNIFLTLAIIVVIVIFVWLVILAIGTYSNTSGGWKTYALLTFPIGTLASIVAVGLVMVGGKGT